MAQCAVCRSIRKDTHHAMPRRLNNSDLKSQPISPPPVWPPHTVSFIRQRPWLLRLLALKNEQHNSQDDKRGREGGFGVVPLPSLSVLPKEPASCSVLIVGILQSSKLYTCPALSPGRRENVASFHGSCLLCNWFFIVNAHQRAAHAVTTLPCTSRISAHPETSFRNVHEHKKGGRKLLHMFSICTQHPVSNSEAKGTFPE